MAENKNAKTPADDDQPVAWRSTSPDGKLANKFVGTSKEVNWTPIYTELTCVCGAVWEGETMVHSPKEREWVGLTDEEVSEIIDREIGFNSCWGPEEKFARAIEQALKEKNT
jgi:hypothetical protein